MSHSRWTYAITPITGAISLIAGVSILLGWWLDIELLRSLLPGYASANITVAICMVVAGISQLTFSLQATSRWLSLISRLIGSLLICLGLITEVSRVFEWQMTLPLSWHTAPGAGLAFCLVGCSAATGRARLLGTTNPTAWIGWMVVGLALVSLMQQFTMGGLILRYDSNISANYVISTALILLALGLGEAFKRTKDPFSMSSLEDVATASERRIFRVLSADLVALMTMLLAVLVLSLENASHYDDFTQVHSMQSTIGKVRDNLNNGVVSSSHLKAVVSVAAESSARFHRAANHEIDFDQCLTHIEQDATALQQITGLLVTSSTYADGTPRLKQATQNCISDIEVYLNSLNSGLIKTSEQNAILLLVIACTGVVLLLPLGLFTQRTLFRSFSALHTAEEEIRHINATLEGQIIDRTRALSQQELNHRNLLDHFPGVGFRAFFDNGFRWDYISSGCYHLLGVTPEELMSGKPRYTDLVYSDDYPNFSQSIKEMLNGKEVHMEYRIIRPDGNMRWVSAYIHPSQFVDGTPQLFAGYLTDISARKDADTRRDLLANVLESLSAGATLEQTLCIVVKAVEHHCPGALCSIMLLDEGGKTLHYGAAPSFPEAYRQSTDQLEIGPSAGSCGTAAFLRKRVLVEDISTDPLWSEYTSIAAEAGLKSCWSDPMFGANGELLGTIAIYTRKPGPPSQEIVSAMGWAAYFGSTAIAQNLRVRDQAARKALETANAVKNRFLAAMSHEIRTPLNGMLGMIDLLLNSEQDPLQKEKMQSAIKESSHVLQKVVDNIIQYSQSESGDLKLNNKALDLPELVRTLMGTLAADAIENDVQLSSSFGPGVPSCVVADGEKLRQILYSLLDNAIKFSGNRAGRAGHVSLSIESRTCEVGMERIFVQTSDDGIGMSTEELKRIGQPFSQLDTTTTRQFDGTGIGLALTKSLLQLMGAELTFASAPGEGLKVSFELLIPACSDEQVRSLAAAPDQIPLEILPQALGASGDRLVLLAEDNRMNQRVIVLQLQTLGYAIDIAENGADALTLWESGRYSLVLADFHMPKMDGFELTRQIRRREKDSGRHTPIIGITASTIPDEMTLSRTVGMDDCVTKPATLEALKSKLTQWLPIDKDGDDPIQIGGALDVPETENGIDWSALGSYMGTDDKALLAEFFTDFLRIGYATLDEIEQAMKAGNAAQVGALAHRLKSSARMVGANAMADNCQQLERSGSKAQWNDIRREQALLRDLFVAVVTEAGEHDIVV